MKDSNAQMAYRVSDTGKYVGFIPGLPNIICQADSKIQLQKRLFAALEKYARHLQNKENIVSKEF